MTTEPFRDRVGELIAHAGARPAPPEAARQSILAAVENEWREVVAERRQAQSRRRLLAAGVAAVAIGLAGYFAVHRPTAPAMAAGTFLASQGSVDIRRDASASPIVGGDDIPAGTQVSTTASGRALFSVGGVSVRVGGSTEVTFVDNERLRVESGRIYVDSGLPRSHATSQGRRSLDVETAFGSVHHVGTQFEVAVDAARLRVRVRDGIVSIQADRTSGELGATDELTIAASGEVTRTVIAPYGEAWNWTQDLSPGFPIEGRTFDEFLQWFAHETGRRLIFDAQSTQRATQSTRLSGSIAGMRPDAALQAVAASTRFECDISNPALLSVAAGPAPPVATGDAKLPRDAQASGQSPQTSKD